MQMSMTYPKSGPYANINCLCKSSTCPRWGQNYSFQGNQHENNHMCTKDTIYANEHHLCKK